MDIEETISTEDARCFYDRLGAAHDFGHMFERQAKQQGLERLQLEPGMRLLNVGVGTGKEQVEIQKAIAPGGEAYGIDLSRTMLQLCQERVPAPGNALVCEADARRLPFAEGVFDRIFSSYMLDLIPSAAIPSVLKEMHRVLHPEGRLVLVSLTGGSSPASLLLMGAWKAFYRVSPYSLGGCRPVHLTYPLLKAGFARVQRDVVIQLGMPSELLVAYP